jgi:hypothetical protein
MVELMLPTADGRLESYRLGDPCPYPTATTEPFNRVAYAAAHVVADPLADNDPWIKPAIDWEATIAFRHMLWGLGFKIAEAMDTAQRGMGLDWPSTLELIRRSLDAAKGVPGADLACGAGTDQLARAPGLTLDDVIAAYEEQIEAIETLGGRTILMASQALVAAAKGPDDYLSVYSRLITQARDKVILHWLGETFDPLLKGYWGADDPEDAMQICLSLIKDHTDKIDGIKISLLDKSREVRMRRLLPQGVKMFTGDDFNYAELIEGDAEGHSHALLGIFDPIAQAASAALCSLAQGDTARYRQILEPTVPLSRQIFKAPTQFYKAGVVFLAWLNGHQQHFSMVGGLQSSRSLVHYAEILRLADQAGILVDPDLAASRMQHLLALNGVSS